MIEFMEAPKRKRKPITQCRGMEQAKLIRKLYAEGYTGKQLAEQFRLSVHVIYGITSNRHYCDEKYQLTTNPHRFIRAGRIPVITETRRLFSAGLTYGEISDKLHISETSARNYCTPRFAAFDKGWSPPNLNRRRPPQ